MYKALVKINLEQLSVRPVNKAEEPRYRELMQQYRYLGNLAKIGNTIWYVAILGEERAALLGFSASAWKRDVRNRWIGLNFCNKLIC